MIKDIWDSLKDNLKERTTNPFLGTLLIVWIIHNWELVYGLFTFDSDTKQQTKLDYVNKYFEKEGFVVNLLSVVCITVIVLFATYLLLNISRLIVNYFEKCITPWVYKMTDRGSVVLKSDYEKLIAEIRTLEQRIESEREAKHRAQTERDELEKRFYNNNSLPDEKDIFSATFNKLINKYSNSEIDDVIISAIQGKTLFDNAEIISDFIKYGLLEVKTRGTTKSLYKLTDEGQKFRTYFYNQ